MLPVSGLAAGAYLALLLASFFIGPRVAPPDRRLAWGAMLLLAGAAAGSAIWFTILQKWTLGAFCPYCMATHAAALILATLIITRAPSQWRTESSAAPDPLTTTPRKTKPKPAYALALAGLLLAGMLAVAQLALAPPPAVRSGDSQAAAQLPVVDPRNVPLIGPPGAAHIVTVLFDHRCPHCQKIHAMLDEIVQRYDGKLAFALCPTPLNIRCNPYISRELDEFKDSCELARLSLAVWAADRGAFPAFDRWLFSPDPGEDRWHPRTFDAARTKAIELVGQPKLDAASRDPWIDLHLQASIRLFGNTISPDHAGGSVPKLVYGTRWVTPEPTTPDDLLTTLQKNLALPKQNP
jgi:protein-disulfide isomerase